MTLANAEAPMRVLVVDDDIDTTESTALLFQMQGHETKTARNGVAATEQTKVFCPDLILLDIAMPKMDGFQVLRELRDIPCAAESTIVAVTGYANVAERRQCAEAGFDLHFPKPLDFGRIAATRVALAAIETIARDIQRTCRGANGYADRSDPHHPSNGQHVSRYCNQHHQHGSPGTLSWQGGADAPTDHRTARQERP